jgi:hypothetical protein
MSLPETVRHLLVSRAAADPDAARLLEMFIRAEVSLSEHSLDEISDAGTPKLFSTSITNNHRIGRAGSVSRPQVHHGH